MTTTPERVEYLIIGAGMAGLVLKRLLASPSVVLIDPNPAGYKIGESIIPEHFAHPELRALLPAIRALPSYTVKWGTAFVSDDSVASFPLPTSEAGVAMHVARPEIERLMIDAWGTDIRRERVTGFDWPARRVVTDTTTYEVTGTIIDCSGPGMVVASALGDAAQMWPVWAKWTYFDVEARDDQAFFDAARAAGKRYLRFDAVRRQILPGDETPGWAPTHTTLLTRLGPGTWTWQIPLYDSRLLSVGLVSREAEITDAEFFATAERHTAACYRLARRTPDPADPYRRVHQRGGFARRASVASTRDYILVADAFCFADPVYSVGTGLAVNKAIEVATLLNAGGWSDERSAFYNASSDRMLAQTLRAFDFWYNGDVLRDDAAASEVQRNCLAGSAFHVLTAEHYGNLLRQATLGDGTGAAALRPPTDDGPGLDPAVRALLALDDDATLADWRLGPALRGARGLELRFRREGKPELMVIAAVDDTRQCYKRVEGIALAYLNVFNGRYPFDPATAALLDALAAKLAANAPAWRALITAIPA